MALLTVIETPTFSRLWPRYWTEEEFGEFAGWLAANPEAGKLVRGSSGVRKVRWMRRGVGKSGGVRIIYFNQLSNRRIWLLLIYSKSQADSLPVALLREMRDEIEKTTD